MIPLQIPDFGAAVGPFVRYRTGAVYRDDRIIGHLVGAAPGLDQPGEGCGKLWRSERDPAACREYERVVAGEVHVETTSLNWYAIEVLADHPEHPQAASAASLMLHQWISDTSEDCWCATWMTDAPTELYAIVSGGGGNWGMGNISAAEAALVRKLMRVGGWWADSDAPIAADKVADWWREVGP